MVGTWLRDVGLICFRSILWGGHNGDVLRCGLKEGVFSNLAHKPASEHLQMRSVRFLIACMEGDAFFSGPEYRLY